MGFIKNNTKNLPSVVRAGRSFYEDNYNGIVGMDTDQF